MNATGNDVGDLVVDAMREDGLLPAKLPEWKTDEVSPQPPPSIRYAVQLTDTVAIRFEAGAYCGAYLTAHLFGRNNLEPFTTAEARKREILPKLLTEVETALPVLRAMVAEVQG